MSFFYRFFEEKGYDYRMGVQSRQTSTSVQTTGGKVSTVNSSVATLANGAVFTGTSEDISGFATATIFVDSDQDGTLSMQFSSDGTNWDRSKNVVINQDISTGSVHTIETISQFFRVVYTNGSVTQTHFRLQTIFHVYRSGFLTSSPDEIISKINDAQIVRVSNDPNFDISRGLYADKESTEVSGKNITVPNGSFADIWSYGPTDATYNWPTTAETFQVQAGGNVNDTSAGSGARTLQIIYLDATGAKQQEQLTLAGASASTATSVTATRFLKAFVDSAGSILSNNTGQILIENSTSNQIVGTITAGFGESEMSHYTVPLDFTAYLNSITVDVSAGSNKDADVRMWQRTNALTFSAPFGVKRIVREWDGLQGESTLPKKHLPRFASLTDIWLEAKGNGAATAVDTDYEIILVKDEAPTSPQ